jgi:hypothetical protein
MLIDRGDPEYAADPRRSPSSEQAMSVTDLKPEFIVPGVTGQFIISMYCERCGLGYIPDSITKPPRLGYKSVERGWRQLNGDGTVGPVLRHIPEDPDLQDKCTRPFIGPAAANAEIDEIEASRMGDELILRHGRTAHIVAKALSESAQAAGELRAAQFWLRVSQGIRPR